MLVSFSNIFQYDRSNNVWSPVQISHKIHKLCWSWHRVHLRDGGHGEYRDRIQHTHSEARNQWALTQPLSRSGQTGVTMGPTALQNSVSPRANVRVNVPWSRCRLIRLLRDIWCEGMSSVWGTRKSDQAPSWLVTPSLGSDETAKWHQTGTLSQYNGGRRVFVWLPLICWSKGALKVIFSLRTITGKRLFDPSPNPPSLFVREGINEQIWTKLARTEKILILHLHAAQLVAPVQKTQGGRKVLQSLENSNNTDADGCSFFQFSISCVVASEPFYKLLLGKKRIFLRAESHQGPPVSDQPSEWCPYNPKPKFC